jgi:hypothetical protein
MDVKVKKVVSVQVLHFPQTLRNSRKYTTSTHSNEIIEPEAKITLESQKMSSDSRKHLKS